MHYQNWLINSAKIQPQKLSDLYEQPKMPKQTEILTPRKSSNYTQEPISHQLHQPYHLTTAPKDIRFSKNSFQSPLIIQDSNIFQDFNQKSKPQSSKSHIQEITQIKVDQHEKFSETYSEAPSNATDLSNRSQIEKIEILKHLGLYKEILIQLQSERKNLQQKVYTHDETIYRLQTIIKQSHMNINELKKRLESICRLNGEQQQIIQELRFQNKELLTSLLNERQQRKDLINNIETTKQQIKKEIQSMNQKTLYQQRYFYQKQRNQMSQQLQKMKKSCRSINYSLQLVQNEVIYFRDKIQHKITTLYFVPQEKSRQSSEVKFSWYQNKLRLLQLNTMYQRIVGKIFYFDKKGNKQIRFRIKQGDFSCSSIILESVFREKDCNYQSTIFSINPSMLDIYQMEEYGVKEKAYYTGILHMKRIDDETILVSWLLNDKVKQSQVVYQSNKKFRLCFELNSNAKERGSIQQVL